MLLNSLILLLLSNSITSRRDKSILYSRATITILLISAFIAYENFSFLFLAKGIGIFGGLFHTTATTNYLHTVIFLAIGVIVLLCLYFFIYVVLYYNKFIFIIYFMVFIPLWLGWSIPYFCVLVLLTLEVLMYLPIIYNDSYKGLYSIGDTLGVLIGYYSYLLETSMHLDHKFLSINIIIGISMIIIGLSSSQEPKSIVKIFTFFMNNKKLFFIFVIGMVLLIFLINMFLSLLGLGITVNTSYFTLFLYTFFAKVISIKLILTFLFSCITKDFKLENLSLSLYTVIFIFISGSINYYYVLPYVYLIMPFFLTKMDNIVTCISFLTASSGVKSIDTKGLIEGVSNLLTKFPVIGRFLDSFKGTNYVYNTSSPFKLHLDNVFRNKINVYPLTKISKFVPISISTIMENTVDVTYSYKGSSKELAVLLRENTLHITNLFSNYLSNYLNLTCKIHLKCEGQIININAIFKSGLLETFDVNKTNVNFKANKAAVNKELMELTKPGKSHPNLQVFMNENVNSYNYPFPYSESSTAAQQRSELNESTQDYDYQSTNPKISMDNYTCINFEIWDKVNAHAEPEYLQEVGKQKAIPTRNEDHLIITLNPTKLSQDGYLYEICRRGRKYLMEHSCTKGIDPYNYIENFNLESIVFSNLDMRLDIFHVAFLKEFQKIITSGKINPTAIYPFSKVYINEDDDYLLNDFNTDNTTETGQLDLNQVESTVVNSNTVVGSNTLVSSNTLVNSNTVVGSNTVVNSNTQGPTEIYILMQTLITRKNSGDFSYNFSNFWEQLGFEYVNNRVLDKTINGENSTTLFLTNLINFNPDFCKAGNRFTITVDVLLAKLNKLALEHSVFDLSPENYIRLSKELKFRIQRFILYNTNSKSDSDLGRAHLASLGIKRYPKPSFLVYEESKVNWFTLFLGKLLIEKPGVTRLKYAAFADLKVKQLYSYVINLIPNTLTKNDIGIILFNLQKRKGEFLATLKSSDIESCLLTHCGFTIKNDIVLELHTPTPNYEFARLLDKLNLHLSTHPDIKLSMNSENVDRVINTLKSHYLKM